MDALNDLLKMGFIQEDEYRQRLAELGVTAPESTTTTTNDSQQSSSCESSPPITLATIEATSQVPPVASNSLSTGPNYELKHVAPVAESRPTTVDNDAVSRQIRNGVVLFLSGITSSLKVKKDIARMRNLLDTKKIRYEVVDVAKNKDALTLVESISKKRELPQILAYDRFVGNAEIIEELNESGALLDALSESGVMTMGLTQ